MKKNHWITTVLTGLLINSAALSQGTTSLAEHLGYPSDAKLLIVHADDLGLSHSANTASMNAFEKNGISSGSIMVPCPWFAEFASYARDHPELDVGIHFTLTSEWKHYRWDGVSPSSEISSLLDENGYFYASTEEVAQHADPVEVEKEFRAQIERALAFGIKPTHFDTHMASAGARPELFQIYLQLGKEYNTPVLLPRFFLLGLPAEDRDKILSEYVLLDNIYMMGEEAAGKTWSESYRQMTESMKPGLNQLIVHLGFDDEEMKAISIDHDAYGAAWRQKDLDYVLSEEFKELLKENDIQMVGWKEIQDYMKTKAAK